LHHSPDAHAMMIRKRREEREKVPPMGKKEEKKPVFRLRIPARRRLDLRGKIEKTDKKSGESEKNTLIHPIF
jgi:hypothetical protein